MQVMFIQNVAGTARKGEIKTVKEGYYRNYLLPRNLAVIATGSVQKQAEKMMKNEVIQKERLMAEAKDVINKIDGLEIEILAKSSGERLYGSLGEKEILDAVESKIKVRLEKHHLLLDEPIKKVGVFEIPVKITDGAEATIKVIVKSD